MITILALDPGRTTGYAYALLDKDAKIAYGQREMDHYDFYRFVLGCIPQSYENDFYVICESFEFRQAGQTGVDLYPCELIGVLNYCASGNKFQDRVYMQPASIQGSKKTYFSDTMLKDLGLYQKGVEHGRSAVKHLLHWLQFGHGSQFEWITSELVDENWLWHKGTGRDLR